MGTGFEPLECSSFAKEDAFGTVVSGLLVCRPCGQSCTKPVGGATTGFGGGKKQSWSGLALHPDGTTSMEPCPRNPGSFKDDFFGTELSELPTWRSGSSSSAEHSFFLEV